VWRGISDQQQDSGKDEAQARQQRKEVNGVRDGWK